MFIGEGPGYQEDRQGRPFVGPAGQFLEELLQSIGLTRRQVFIANMVKCRPPQNRDPAPAEIEACSKYLDRQVELVDPELIVTLGRFSLARFFPGETISRARGRLRQQNGRHVFPIMHPAAALHRPEFRATIIEDFQAIPAILGQLRQTPAQATQTTRAAPEAPPEQLALF
jgi:DNA polymerase